MVPCIVLPKKTNTMKIIHIIPGFGGTFYCGNCLRDSSLIRSLRMAGHDAITLPMYLPLSIEDNPVPEEIPVFYGAVNIYLKQRFPFLRKMPSVVTHLLNANPLLRLAAKKSGSTRATGLEEMTESMLLGNEGHQSEELQQLVDFLKKEQPDVVHLSNALLLGLAGEIKRQVAVPVVYSLQDEDVWVDVMEEPYRQRIWDLMAEKAKDVDLFIAVSHYFSGVMQQKMRLDPGKIKVHPVGVDPEGYVPVLPGEKNRVIGFLSRIGEANGFGTFVDAFVHLNSLGDFNDVKLKVLGGRTNDDKPFIKKQLNKLKQAGLEDRMEIGEDFVQGRVHDFFKEVSMLSVPVKDGEAFGLYLLEAMASAVPVVQPAVGAFPEIIEMSRGGIVYPSQAPEALAEAWAQLLQDPGKMNQLGEQGRNAVETRFNTHNLARELVTIYQDIPHKKS
jgi:glycosyltransferase involved in cell wall biosynthesis